MGLYLRDINVKECDSFVFNSPDGLPSVQFESGVDKVSQSVLLIVATNSKSPHSVSWSPVGVGNDSIG